MSAEEATVVLKRGALCFSKSDIDRFFPGIDAVVLLRDGDALVILPVVAAAAGGYLLKQRNLKGDRIAHAAGFLRGFGIDDEPERSCTAGWSAERAALVIPAFFSVQT